MIRKVNAKVTEAQTKRHGLETFLGSSPVGSSVGTNVHIQILSELGHLNLRGDPNDDRFVKAAQDVLGQELPVIPNTTSVPEHQVYWLGPDEWLIVSDASGIQTLREKLETAFSGISAAVNDVSGGQLLLRVTGPQVRDVLAKGCTLDFHSKTFTAGMCAQSGLAKANVLIGVTDQDTAFHIVVRRSFAEYLLRWLQHASEEFGVTISSA
jgi:sarcosine oxidase subunit gamma